jgi:hypothetical protein
MVGESPLLQHRQAPDIGDDPADEGIRQHIAQQAPPKVSAARGLIVDIFRDLIQKTPRWGVGRSSVGWRSVSARHATPHRDAFISPVDSIHSVFFSNRPRHQERGRH